MRKHFLKVTALSAAALLCFSSCFMERNVTADELSATYKRQATTTGEINEDFALSMSNLSVKMLQETLTQDDKNELVSPLSAALCLALIANGANGNTLTQLESLFGMDIDSFNQAMYAYTSSLPSTADCEVNIANSIWMKENELNVEPAFLQTNADWYGAQAYSAPFNNTTLQDINNWCYNQTKGKIAKAISDLPEDVLMILINALDFDAKWNKKYETDDIRDRNFYNHEGDTSTVKMLYSTEYTYLYDDYAMGFTRAYKGNNYSFVGILPDAGVDIYEYISTLSGEGWRAMWNERVTHTVHAGIPEFEYDVDLNLSKPLQALGVTDMFDRNLADFSSIDKTLPLYCSLIKQKAKVQLDRNGTKLSAITFGFLNGGSAPPPQDDVYIILDRPFVYAVVDNSNGLPLFMGAVTNL